MKWFFSGLTAVLLAATLWAAVDSYLLLEEDRERAGVEIQEPSREFAASYLFYSESGTQLYDTASFGSPDFTWDHNGSIKWASNRNGFEESDVYSVAAKGSQGQVSAPTTCVRQFLH